MRPVSSVTSSPSSDAAKSLFILHEGTKVKVLDEVSGYSDVELADGRRGWIATQDIERI
jgi:SH3-like domain-containing protein